NRRKQRAVVAQLQPVEDMQPLGRASKGAPGAHIDALVEVERNARAVFVANASPAELCGEDPGVVDDQDVARIQEFEQVGDIPVEGRLAGTNNEQAGTVARFSGMERDAVFGEVEIEFGNTHAGSAALAGVADDRPEATADDL